MTRFSLHDADFDEVSVVDFGSNPESMIVLAKRGAPFSPGRELSLDDRIAKVEDVAVSDGAVHLTLDDGRQYVLSDLTISKSEDGEDAATIEGEATLVDGEVEGTADSEPQDPPAEEAPTGGAAKPSGEEGGFLARFFDAVRGFVAGDIGDEEFAKRAAREIREAEGAGAREPVEKMDFNAAVVRDMSYEVTNKIWRLVDAFVQANDSATYEGEGDVASLLRRNLDQFRAAVEKVIDDWIATLPIAKHNSVARFEPTYKGLKLVAGCPPERGARSFEPTYKGLKLAGIDRGQRTEPRF